MGESAQLPISARFLGMESGDSSWAGEVERKHFGFLAMQGRMRKLSRPVDEENLDPRRNERVFSLIRRTMLSCVLFPELNM